MYRMTVSEEIRSLLKDFYEVTGERVGLFDREFRIMYEYPQECCLFCRKIRETRQGLEACHKCDIDGLRRTVSPYPNLYRCHAGLIEVCVPIYDGERIGGYLMFGQVLNGDDREHFPRYASVSEYMTADEWNTLLPTVKTVSEGYLSAASHMLSACVSYIYTKKLLREMNTDLYRQIEYAVERDMTEDLTLDRLSEELNVSVSTICKKVRERGGTTVGAMIRDKRMHKACELLASTSMSVGQIAEHVGIADYNYFSRIFRRMTGYSPTEYRKSTVKSEDKVLSESDFSIKGQKM